MVEIDGTPRERLGETVTSPYPHDDEDSEWDALLTAIANEFDEVETVLDNVENAKFVDDATGTQLDKLATLFQIERETGESDAIFRTRIKARLRAQLSSGTNEDIRSAAAALLDADTSVIDIIEPDDDERPAVNVVIPVDDFSQIQTPGDIWNEVLDSVAAVGVDLSTIVDVGSFRVRVFYTSASNQTINEGDFGGVDAFDGRGSFGGGDSDDTEDTTTLAFDAVVSFDPPSNQTVFEGFGQSAFGAGAFDGNPDDADVRGETSADGFAIVASFNDGASSTINEGDFAGADAFDGQGAFGGGDSDAPTSTTSQSYQMAVSYVSASSTEKSSGFGESAFGAGAFDGLGDDEDVRSQTGVSYSVTHAFLDATSSEVAVGDFAGADSFDGQGAFGAGESDSPDSTTGVSYSIVASFVDASSADIISGFGSSAFGAGSFDGSADAENTSGSTSSATTLTVVWNSATNNTAVSDGFGSGSFDGSGTFS